MPVECAIAPSFRRPASICSGFGSRLSGFRERHQRKDHPTSVARSRRRRARRPPLLRVPRGHPPHQCHEAPALYYAIAVLERTLGCTKIVSALLDFRCPRSEPLNRPVWAHARKHWQRVDGHVSRVARMSRHSFLRFCKEDFSQLESRHRYRRRCRPVPAILPGSRRLVPLRDVSDSPFAEEIGMSFTRKCCRR